MPLTASLVAGLVGDAAQTGLGFLDRAKAKKLRESAGDLTYDIQNEYYTNKNLAASQAQSGFSDASKNFFSNQVDRGLTSGIDTVLQAGGGVNSVQGLYDQYNQANNRFAAQDSEMQAARIDKLILANKDLAGQKTQKWAIEEYEPWKNKMLAAAQATQSGTQNIIGGVKGAAGRLAAFGMANDYDQLTDEHKAVTPKPNMITSGGVTNPNIQSVDFGPLINNQGPLTPAQIKAYKDAASYYPDSPYLKGFVLPDYQNVA